MKHFMFDVLRELLGVVKVVGANVDMTCHWSVKLWFLTVIIDVKMSWMSLYISYLMTMSCVRESLRLLTQGGQFAGDVEDEVSVGHS